MLGALSATLWIIGGVVGVGLVALFVSEVDDGIDDCTERQDVADCFTLGP